MKLRKLIAACAAIALPLTSFAENIDPDVKTGTLPNGLTYYIQKNDNPKGTADFFLAQKVGSINENEDQRGLAHFLEHMCFNGTEHFPGNSLISYLESIGVKFGAHLNAYTSTDETVYNISKAPTARWSAVDSCLLILRDWSCALTLNDADIDSERGIIVNEWRQRRTASNRMLEKAMPRLYDGDIYGNRMPIGLMSVVENFKPQTLRDFYDRWYIPANQAIIVTGDFDIKKMEKSLRRIFSDIPASRSPISEKIGLHTVPMAPALTTVVESDAEQGVEMMQIYFRIAPEDAAATPAHDAIAEMAETMLANRFDALEASSDCPHTSLGIGEVRFLMSRGEKAITLRGTLKPGKAEEALEAWYAEVLRAIRHGFSDQEIIEARQALMATLDERQRADAHSSNTRLAKKIVRHFLDGGRKVNGSEYRDQIRKAAGRVTSDDVVAYLGKAVRPSGKGAVILHYRPDSGQNDDAAHQKRLADVFAATSARPLAPYVPLSSAGSILAAEPDPGHITGRDSLPVFGAMVYKLSNGISVIAKKTEFKPDQIYVRGYSPGGLSQVYDPADVPTLRAVNDLMNSMNYSGRTQADLRRILGTTNIKVSQSVGNMEEGIEAATNRADMTDAFRMIFLRATGFEADSTAFRSWMDSQRNAIAGKRLNPTQAMGDTIHTTIYSRHPLAARNTLQDIERIDLQKAVGIYADRYGDMSDFTFMVVGDFNSDSLEYCLEHYIASLPGGGRKEKAKDIGYRYTPHDFTLTFERAMENPQSVVYTFYSGPAQFSLADRMAATAFGQILRSRLLADLREERGWTYSVKAHAGLNAGINGDDGPVMLMPVYVKVTPGHEQETAEIVRQTVKSMMTPGNISSEEVAAIKEFLLKSHRESLSDNAYWLQIIKIYQRDGIDAESGYRQAVDALSPQTVAEWASRTVGGANRAVLTMIAKEAPKDHGKDLTDNAE